MKKLMLLIAVLGLMSPCVRAELVTYLTDDFNVAETIDQNYDLASRQTGVGATMAWDDLNYNTQGNPADWDSRVMINSSGQLQVGTGGGEAGLWNPGFMSLPQSAEYSLSWDQGNSGSWSFVRFNSTATGYNLETGILVSGNTIQVFRNGSIIVNATAGVNINPASGENGLHHIEVTADGNGNILFIANGSGLTNADFTGIGTIDTGVGYFSMFTESSSTGYLDNFSYSAVVPEPATIGLLAIGSIFMIRRKK